MDLYIHSIICLLGLHFTLSARLDSYNSISYLGCVIYHFLTTPKKTATFYILAYGILFPEIHAL